MREAYRHFNMYFKIFTKLIIFLFWLRKINQSEKASKNGKCVFCFLALRLKSKVNPKKPNTSKKCFRFG